MNAACRKRESRDERGFQVQMMLSLRAIVVKGLRGLVSAVRATLLCYSRLTLSVRPKALMAAGELNLSYWY